MKAIITNRKAFRDFNILQTIECGIELRGSEVKSLRAGKVTMDDSFARVEEGEVILYNTHISPYEQASYLNVEADRQRKLLLHKKEIAKLEASLMQKGLTLVPLKAYFNDRGFVKVELGLARGKKLYDKRVDIKKRESQRAISRLLKNRR